MRGNFAPVMDELSEEKLAVSGQVPRELNGLYLRNGGNPRHGTPSHWFFGDGMVHGVRLREGRAEWYRNRWVRTSKLERDLDPMDPVTLVDRRASVANTHVIGHAGRILALEEAHFPYQLSPELETLGCLDFGGKLTSAFTAHPKLCPETNELHFFGYSPVPPFLVYHVLDAQGDLVHSAEIEVPGATMMHDFIITREHAIFMDLPVVFDVAKMASGAPPIAWDESYGARIGILPRFGSNPDVRWFEIEPCYVFHAMNAFVSGDEVVCDVGRHAYMWRDSMEDFAPCLLTRWTFDLASGTAKEEQLDDAIHAFPRIDDRAVGLKNRYGWAVTNRPGAGTGLGEASRVVRYDLERGTQAHHDFGPAAQAGEFVFAEARPGAADDEGWALGFVYDAERDASDLVILDAGDPAAEAVARIHMPRRVPHGFHGSWLRD
jgi:carotenoid cleavage dioxygenase